MIASLRGDVLSSGAGWVVVGVGAGGNAGGVGLRVEVPSRLAGAAPGQPVSLHTQLVVREDSLTLFGFETAEELEMFGLLIGVSGVGPRSALGVLSALTPVQIATAVRDEDEKPFRKVSGIGPKTAKLIAVQLGGKIDPRAFASAAGEPEASAAGSGARAHVEQGLIGLGYGEAEAEAAVVDAIAAGAPDDEAGLLRAALALLQSPRAATGGARR